MFLSELIKTFEVSPGAVAVRVPSDWMQGRSVFGGLQAGIALAAMRTLVPDMPLRTLQATFMSPLQGDVLTARATVLRAGKNTVHIEARLVEGEQTLGVVIGVFGLGRASEVNRRIEQPTVESSRPKAFRYVPGVTPAFTQFFKPVWLRGGFPFTGSTLPEAVIQLGMHDAGLSTELHVLALADFIPPVGLSLMTKPAPGSTLTWMLEFLTTELAGLPLDGWRVDAEMQAAGEGYTSQTVTLWGPHGQAVALSRQSMVIFG
jgi:acyl-CoA thioesterase